MNSNIKGHGYFRKSKAYGLVCGIALAGAFAFSGSNVSADQVSSASSTNQPEVVTTLPQATNNQAQPVTSSTLDTAVSSAQNAGVVVNTKPAVSYTDVSSSQADLASQTQTVKDATAKAEANTTAIKDATAQNVQIDAQNQAEATRVAEINKAGQLAVDKKNAQGQALVDKQNADAQAQADATNAQLKADYEAKLAEIKTVEDYNKAVAERNALAKQLTDTTNAQLKAEYQAKLAEYDAKLAEAQANTNKTGYLSEVLTQGLIFDKEPNATVSISGGSGFTRKLGDPVSSTQPNFEILSISTDIETVGVVLKPGQSVTATYENLQNSSYDGKKISKIVYQFTNPSGAPYETLVHVTKDPTNGLVTFAKSTQGIRTDIEIKFYDVDGNIINFNANHPAILGISSLNNNADAIILTPVVKDDIERVVDYNFKFVPITGSVVKEHADGIYSDTNTTSKALGSQFDTMEWDQETNPNFYYASGAGVVSSGNTIKFSTFNSNTSGYYTGQWLTISSKVAAPVVPAPPAPPTLKTFTPEAEKPVPQTPPVPVYVTPILKTFTPEVYTPIKPTVKPHVVVPEKLSINVSVHPVLVPVANPSKDIVDKSGKTINGLSVLPNSELNYVAKQDFSQYKGITASNDKVAKNFIYIDDYDEKSLDGKSMVVNSIKASNGQDVSSLLEMHHVLSKDALDEKLQAILKNSGLSPVGEFYMWVAKDPASFYKAYVQKGLDITYNLSFKVNQTFTQGEIVNGVAQIDFGNGYLGNFVVNELPKAEVHKDVLDKQDGKSINNGTVKLGDEVTYKLEGWIVPTGRSYDLFEYKFVDQLQHSHDLYLKDSVIAKVDITLSDGSVIKKGTDLAKYTETVYNKETGLYELAFKKEFLEKVARSSEFGADAFIVVKRIKAGDVYNDYTLYVNGNPVKSNRVVTHTPEDPKPVTPQKVTPKTPALPHTGEASMSIVSVIGASIISLLGLSRLRRKVEK